MAISGNIIIGNKDYSTKPSSNAPDVSGYQATTNKEKNKKKLRDSLDAIVANRGQPGSSTGITSVPTMGKRTDKFKKIEDKVRDGKPLSEAEKVIANFYMSSAPNEYAANIQKFKEQPGGLRTFKEKFPNPLVKIAGGLGKFFEEGTLLGKFMSSLNKSDQNKVNIITNDPQGVKQGPPAYDVNQYGLGNMGPDKILRDLMRQSQQNTIAPYGIPNPGAEASDMGIMTVDQENEAKKRQMVSNHYKVDVSKMSQSTIDAAYEAMMTEFSRETEDNMMGSTSPDFSNFQQQEVVDEVVEGPEQPLDGSNIFEIGSGNLAGSVSETDYTAPNIEGTNPRGQVSSARSTPLIGGDPNVPYGYEENILDVLAEDNMATGGYMSSFPNQNLNTQSLSASDNIDDRIMKNLQYEKMSPGMMGYNAGGYAGMSTFDKLKMIADSGYQS
tara:strand:- start:161 stop:1483 length:1323 start_codon:yes stop_codon:yes gene_type:complete